MEVAANDGLLPAPSESKSQSLPNEWSAGEGDAPLTISASVDEFLASDTSKPWSSTQVVAALRGSPATTIVSCGLRLLSHGNVDAVIAEDIIREIEPAFEEAWKGFEEASKEGTLGVYWDSLDEQKRNELADGLKLKTAEERLKIWKVIVPTSSEKSPKDTGNATIGTSESKEEEVIDVDDPWSEEKTDDTDVELDDPWADDTSENSSPSMTAKKDLNGDGSSIQNDTLNAADEPPLQLSQFLSYSVHDICLSFASAGYSVGLKILRERMGGQIYPYRFDILESLPPWISPTDLAAYDLLPALDQKGQERVWKDLFTNPLLNQLQHLINPDTQTSQSEPQSAEQLSEWYTQQILSIDELGLVDTQLGLVQHAAASGIPELGEIGEDLSLLSRLIYDAHLSTNDQSSWNLASWRLASNQPSIIVSAFLANTNSSEILNDVKRLVLPYLYVLESRSERNGGKIDDQLVNRYVREMILGLPLELALPIFEASKATKPKHERIIKDDLIVAKLALACLYGSDDVDNWSIMSKIFECLPVWEISGNDPEDDLELTSTTLDSIAAFMRTDTTFTSTSSANGKTGKKDQWESPKSGDLMMFFQPLPFASLSRALDILDVHLESGEILSKWNVKVQLRSLLQSARDTTEQKELAERMVHYGMTGGGSRMTSSEEEKRWIKLWDDMLKLNGGGDTLLRGAFGMIEGGELMRIYLTALLKSGKLDVGRKMVKRLQDQHGLKSETLEEVVLETSQAMYDTAESGNMHTGRMKTAYDCLSMAPSKPQIQREKHFIEATSRLSTFSIPSPSNLGKHVTPAEIKSTSNKIELVKLVLQHSNDAFRHEDMVFELASKLGLSVAQPGRGKGNVQDGRIWAMMADRAADIGELDTAIGYAEKAVENVRSMYKRQRGATRNASESKLGETSEEAAFKDQTWRVCLKIGPRVAGSGRPLLEKRLDLLGAAIEICPAIEIPKILEVWRNIEPGRTEQMERMKKRRLENKLHQSSESSGKGHRRLDSTGSNPSTAEDRVLGSRTAARAAKMAFDIGGRFSSHLPTLNTTIRSSSPSSPRKGYSLSPNLLSSGFGSTRAARESFSGTTSGGEEGRKSGEYGRALNAIAFGSNRQGGEGMERVGSEGAQIGMEDVERVRRGARRALIQGVGWLLGAEENETSRET